MCINVCMKTMVKIAIMCEQLNQSSVMVIFTAT